MAKQFVERKNLFQKGQSGNPGGKPKRSAEISELARKECPHAFMRIVMMAQSKALYKRDPKTFLLANEKIIDRAIGKVKETVEHSGNVQVPFIVQVLRYDGTDGAGQKAISLVAETDDGV